MSEITGVTMQESTNVAVLFSKIKMIARIGHWVLTCITNILMVTVDLKLARLAVFSLFGTDEAVAATSHLICLRLNRERDTTIIVSPP